MERVVFSLFRKSQPGRPSSALAQALASDGLPPGMDPVSLSVLEHRGTYSGRRVTYFRVFDPLRVAERAVQIRLYSDLDSHPELVLGSGHREQNGAIVLSRQVRPPASVTLARTQANRSDHVDDEQLVFPDRPA